MACLSFRGRGCHQELQHLAMTPAPYTSDSILLAQSFELYTTVCYMLRHLLIRTIVISLYGLYWTVRTLPILYFDPDYRFNPHLL